MKNKDGVNNQNKNIAEKRGNSMFWRLFALLELLLILGVLILAVLSCGSDTFEILGSPFDGALFCTDAYTGKLAPVTGRHVKGLAGRAAEADIPEGSPFVCRTERIDGLEYLVFADGALKLCYKNEYRRDEKTMRSVVMVEREGRRTLLECSYDLDGDLGKLCPSYTKVGDTDTLIVTAPGEQGAAIPRSIMLISLSDLQIGICDDLAERIEGLVPISLSEEASPFEAYPVLLNVITSKASYRYALSSQQYEEAAPGGVLRTDTESEFTFTADKSGISWNTSVKLHGGLYLGVLSGTLGFSGGRIFISGAKFASLVTANIEDPALMMTMVPMKSLPSRYLTLNGYGDERFIIPFESSIEPCTVNNNLLEMTEDGRLVYRDESGNIISHCGIDVSKYQGNIDWKKVAESGVEFAIIRAGFRGMGEGTLEDDPYFKTNIKGALANGIKVGVYYYSQALTPAEAVEEAEYVLKAVNGYRIDYPIIIDTEHATGRDARANALSMRERTDVCIAFCERIRQAGYRPMIYSNTKYMLMGIDRTRLNDYDMWFAAYTLPLSFPYSFDMLQYSSKGKIDGISGDVDLDISFADYTH